MHRNSGNHLYWDQQIGTSWEGKNEGQKSHIKNTARIRTRQSFSWENYYFTTYRRHYQFEKKIAAAKEDDWFRFKWHSRS